MQPEHDDPFGAAEAAVFRTFGDKQLLLALVSFSVIAALAAALASLVLVQGRSQNLVRPPSPDTRADVVFLDGGGIAQVRADGHGPPLSAGELSRLVRGKIVVVHTREAPQYVRLIESGAAKFVVGQPVPAPVGSR